MQERNLIIVILPAFIRAVACYLLSASDHEAIVPEILGKNCRTPPRPLWKARITDNQQNKLLLQAESDLSLGRTSKGAHCYPEPMVCGVHIVTPNPWVLLPETMVPGAIVSGVEIVTLKSLFLGCTLLPRIPGFLGAHCYHKSMEAPPGNTGAWDGSDTHPAWCLVCKCAQPELPPSHTTGRHIMTFCHTYSLSHGRMAVQRPKPF